MTAATQRAARTAGRASDSTVYTHCAICASYCGLEVTVDPAANRVTAIKPDRENPHSWRDFCRKGKTARDIVEHPRRITTPMRRVGDRYEPATYAEATTDIAARLRTIIDRGGPDAVATYAGNPISTSFGMLMFWTGIVDAIGTGNRYIVSSVDENNLHVVAREMYGNETVSLCADVDRCRCFLLVGMDPAVSGFNWAHSSPHGWNRALAAQAAGAEVFVVDPRRSRTAERADRHLQVRPGQDWALLLAIIKVVFDEGLQRISETVPVRGVDDLRAVARTASLAGLAARCGIAEDGIVEVARRFASAETAFCLTHTGVAHHEYGTLGEWLGHVLNYVTNRVEVPGGRRYEAGSVSLSKLAAAFAPPTAHHSRVKQRPAVLGHHALSELAAEITTPGAGQVRGMLVVAGNPVVSGPHGGALDAALAELDLLVAIDLVQRESHRHADWLIPATHWLERAELNLVAHSIQDEPYVQYANRAVQPPDGVKEEWEFFADLALALDRNLFGRPGVNRFIRASRRIAAWTGRPALAFNPEWIQRILIAYGREIRWREILAHPHGWVFREPRFGDLAGLIATPDKRVNLAPAPFVAACRRALATTTLDDDRYPLTLVNRRRRESMNSWLNEADSLYKLGRGNSLEMHPDDAAQTGVADGDEVEVCSRVGAIRLPVTVSDKVREGVVCIPHGWGSRVFDPRGAVTPESFGANRNLLVDNEHLDELSQLPAANSTPVRVSRATRAAADAPVPEGTNAST